MSLPVGRAAVLGGSLAGLLHAWVLAEAGWQVTLVERDRRPGRAEFAGGVPQARQAHLLMPAGLDAIERLLPGTTELLIDAGAQRLGLPSDIRWLTPAGWLPSFSPRHTIVSLTRPLIDWALRHQVLSHPGIEAREGVDAVGLTVAGPRIAGVRYRRRGDRDRTESVLPAEVVVDATGRTSRTPHWLNDLGLDAPEESVMDGGVSYSTGLFRRAEGGLSAGRALYLQPRPGRNPRFGLLFPVEGDRWMVTVGGMRGFTAPTDLDGFLAFSRELRTPDLYELLKGLEPVAPIHGFRPPPSRRRHYERLAGLPEGLLVVGDAACTFNPMYGQGMSVAARSALVLRDLLAAGASGAHRSRGPIARRQTVVELPVNSRMIQRAVFREAGAAWRAACAEDLRYDTTLGGRRGPLLKLQHAYLDRVLNAAQRSKAAQDAFIDTLSLTAPPTRLFAPAVLLQAALSGGPRGRRIGP
ncbi:NAD(P)/FAD-dependent oxidoreductase [Kitasatospora sp. HPMI-4]|uniref:NAD(P)/FAD-dependent oxidoreductase n=1 Tax=Kitasatospora sp. HPMI-4 TaxID=3448443 RepID=UPI003F1C68B6